MQNGYFRVASCSPLVSVADVKANVKHIVSIAEHLAKEGVELAVFPEMCVTGYTCGDLFHNSALIDGAVSGILEICERTEDLEMLIVVGAPLVVDGTMYNCAIHICQGSVVAIIPKTYLPNYNEFYEKRWWAPAPKGNRTVDMLGDAVPFGTDLVVALSEVKIGTEICEDLWTPVPPSCRLAMAGADVVVNLSASDDLIGKYNYLNSLISQQSARCICGYVYASAGYGESSTDLVFDGKTIIAENGKIMVRNKRWQSGDQYVICDIDIDALRRDRLHFGSYSDCAAREHVQDVRTVCVDFETGFDDWECGDRSEKKGEHLAKLYREIDPRPFVPPTDDAVAERCDEILNIQAAGLAKRLDFIHCHTLVVGISGGLDSTLALLVAIKTFDRLGYDRKGIIGITMPGFGTTGRTYNNAMKLMQQLGITIREIPIGPAVMQHFQDIGHDPDNHDVTYENCQARERTQILMDVANQTGGIVLGTGDLSELALGWATYNGDHMSMYGVNVGVPKTLVRYLVRHFADAMDDAECRATLYDIIDTPISPELTPADEQGNIKQKTEDLVGPYDLHDFFLYYTLRYGFTSERILLMACKAFEGVYTQGVIKKWLKTFMKRFFQQQFKRSCLPDGPKVGSVCLSPRGDWRMPSDASATLWLNLK